MADSPIYFQWQNPNLRKTIYPFREKKLRDFLLIYKEIDLCQKMLGASVAPQVATELIQEVNRVETGLSLAKLRKSEAEGALKSLQQKHRLVLNSEKARKLRQGKVNLDLKLASLEASKKKLERQIDWYQKFAPEHPFYEKYKAELNAVLGPYQELQAQLQSLLAEYNQELAPFEAESKSLQIKIDELKVKIKVLTEDLRKFPRLGKDSTVNPRAAVNWLLLKYERELEAKSQEELLALILERFEAEPQRFPEWLQYMVIHFSGMRYQSAHGSWADPKALLESMQVEELKERIQNTPPAELDRLCTQAKTELAQKKNALTNPREIRPLEIQIAALGNPVNRQTALVNHLSSQVSEKIKTQTNQQVLNEIKARKNQFPDWAWKEVVSRTELRLETKEADWEALTPAERQESWKAENQHWRQIMDVWERRDITEWRKQHALTLSLVVTRAVCNEIAEHIQHLRGVKPAAGLAAKPNYYINHQRNNPGRAFFKRPGSTADFKQGASILFLGWVDREPNAWQVARPIAGVDLLLSAGRPAKVGKWNASDQSEDWKYGFQGDAMVRTARIKVPRSGATGPKFETKFLKDYLRWTHEAIVVEVARLADGDYVLTFETGQIGLNLRPLGRMLNHWDIFVGYVPPAEVEPANLDDMLAREKILPTLAPVPAPAEGMLAFAMPLETEAEPVAEAPVPVDQAVAERAGMQKLLRRWDSLTPRQRQVAALVAKGATSRGISTQLGITPGTVRSHVSNVMHKLDVKNRGDLRRELAPLDTREWAEILNP
ncbi:MAG TPA: LuxR C-terminal-related transcriptional regulator [Anaerolineales bacterium]|nr:LuxR C-terminal-related transcriptional regulator [Anaerolineales bacterium]